MVPHFAENRESGASPERSRHCNRRETARRMPFATVFMMGRRQGR